MRLKYFLRGLGLGIVVTSIILTVSHYANRKMTDNEIIERAYELGMTFVTADNSSNENESTEADTTEAPSGEENVTDKDTTTNGTSDTTSEATTTESETDSKETTQSESSESETDATVVSTGEITTENDTTSSAEETTTEEPTTEPPTEEQTTEEQPGNVITYVLNIVGGMSSNKVCSLLQENGIIQDAGEFDDFLVRNGYADRIRVGSFEVNSTMSYEELAAVFCSR